nr:formylglycine-generating enzyme family protein [Pseudonocardia spinosispora]
MGSEDADINPADGEAPIRPVDVAAFQIDAVAVTNARFAAFVRATGHRTDAERYGWSFVFDRLLPPGRAISTARAVDAPWWVAVSGASWRAPEGPGSTVGDRRNHPVVHVSWHDAVAFCAWSGTRLPTEAEWEFAARGGLEQARYPWGDTLTDHGRHRCNIWQGEFPTVNTLDDGHLGTAPVKEYRPNGYGLFNMVGNVWEWTSEPFAPPSGVEQADDPRAMRGGSYLCHSSYCNRYRVAARTSNSPDSSAGNIGFRVAADVGQGTRPGR